MQKSNVHKVLAALIKRQGITPTELSRRTTVGQSTISRILSQKIAKPTDEQVFKLASYFNVSTDQMHGRVPLDGESDVQPPAGRLIEAEAVMEGPIEVWSDDTPVPDDEIAVPFLKEVELAAGSGRLSIELNDRRRLRFGKYSLRNQGVDPEGARCVTVSGNSMEPVLRNGSTVGVDTSQTRVIDGDMYAINHSGQLRVKQLYRLPGGGLRVRSFNRDEHPDEEYTIEEIQDQELIIIGRVFWSGGFH
ncbi:LexA family transcriptional regulator [Pseudomonas sp. C9-3]|uniref:LexA family transcriptional regulator n=1 Tax=Pseudomonas sp. C9-3 TaxID=3078264 RepID=UPI0028EFFDEE|nr:S24 family peptidase [Pseudomonas sp. C9-3]